MKRSMFGLIALAVMACAAACAKVVDKVVDAAYFAYKVVSDVVAHAFKLAKPDAESRTPRVIGFVQAKAFVLRIAKRERPVIENSWRMCTSV